MDDAELASLGHLSLAEACREATRWGRGGEVCEKDGVLLFATGSWVPVVSNGLFLLGPSTSPGEAVQRAEAFFAERGRGYTVFLRYEDDHELCAAAEEAGLMRFGEGSPEMVCRQPLERRPLPPGVELRRVETPDQVADFATVNADAYAVYGMPPGAVADYFSRPEGLLGSPHVYAVVAYERDQPVAAALALLSHGIAGIHWVGTVADAGRRGLGDAVTRAVTNAAFDRGARATTLQASVMGEPLYRRMGYETLYRYEHRYRLVPAS